MTLTTTPDLLVSTLADSLRSQWRKILDHGGGAALTAMDPLVMDVARNIAQGLMLFADDAVEPAESGGGLTHVKPDREPDNYRPGVDDITDDKWWSDSSKPSTATDPTWSVAQHSMGMP